MKRDARFIIALGESIVITGSTTADLELTTARVVAFGLAFLATAALWWLYFNLVATIRRAPAGAGGEPHPARARCVHVPPRGDRRRDPPQRSR